MRAAAALAVAVFAAGCGPPNTLRNIGQVESRMKAAGLLRTETAPADAPFGNRDLVRNFSRIAFYAESFSPDAPGSVATRLSKWRGKVTWTIVGDAVLDERAKILRFTARLGRLTGLEFAPAQADADIVFLFLDYDQRLEFRALLETAGDLERLQHIARWTHNQDVLCFASTWSKDDAFGYQTDGLIGIPTELSRFLRDSCIEEELAQSLGLPNDDPEVRPSIFNDDEEFAFMTAHDEYLLRILYDDRLKVGMTEAEAMPIVRRIVAEIGPG